MTFFNLALTRNTECVEMKNSVRLLVQGIRRITLDGVNLDRNSKMLDDQNRLYWGDVSNVEEVLKANDQTKVPLKSLTKILTKK